jgi:hypothetical protein
MATKTPSKTEAQEKSGLQLVAEFVNSGKVNFSFNPTINKAQIGVYATTNIHN